MPYLAKNPVEGEKLGYGASGSTYVETAPTSLAPNEYVISDENYSTGGVWEQANKRLRQIADTDRLRWAKRDKKNAFSERMHQEIKALFPEVASVEGAWVAEALIDAISDPRGARVGTIKNLRDKRATKHTEVDGKTTKSDVEAVSWEA